jgi:hypothetical protein
MFVSDTDITAEVPADATTGPVVAGTLTSKVSFRVTPVISGFSPRNGGKIVPVWFGAMLVLGLPGHDVLYPRLWSFGNNLFAISGAALCAYAALHLGKRRGVLAPPEHGKP